jgi:hypothetical protein
MERKERSLSLYEVYGIHNQGEGSVGEGGGGTKLIEEY